MDSDGIGAFFYPIVLAITDKERIDYQDSELNKPPSYGTRKIVSDHSLQDKTRIVVTDDGFIGIFKKDIADVLKILNTIFATGITFGVGSEFVREKDLCKFKEAGDSNYIRLVGIGGPSERNMFHVQRDSDSGLFLGRNINTRRVYLVEAIKKVLDHSIHYLAARDSEENIYDDLLLALKGYTLFYRGTLRAAYLYGWMIIETSIDRIWRDYVANLEIPSKDKNNLKDSHHWTTQHKIEVLFASEKLSPKYRRMLKGMRKKRNDIMHEKWIASPRDAFECLRLATVTTLNRLSGNTDIFYDPKEKQLLEVLDRLETESKYTLHNDSKFFVPPSFSATTTNNTS